MLTLFLMENLLPGDGKLYYEPHFYDEKKATLIFSQLHTTIQWRQESVKVFGRVHPQPRLVSWVADQGLSYAYSGLKLEPEPWTPLLKKIKNEVEAKTKEEFNSVLLNLYRHEKDSNGWHSDNEKELGENPFIASLSFGEERDFLIKHKSREGWSQKIRLHSGSLLLMGGETQHHWKHSLPKRSKPLGPRINLTFRKILDCR